MSNAADIVVNDGQATPVAITFKVVKASPELTVWKDRRKAKIQYWPELSLSADLPNSKALVRKDEFRVAVPVVDAVTGAVTGTIRVRVSADIPVIALQADVNDAYMFTANGLVNNLIKAAIKDLDPIIG